MKYVVLSTKHKHSRKSFRLSSTITWCTFMQLRRSWRYCTHITLQTSSRSAPEVIVP